MTDDRQTSIFSFVENLRQDAASKGTDENALREDLLDAIDNILPPPTSDFSEEIKNAERVLSPEEIASRDYRARDKVRSEWGDLLKSCTVWANVCLWAGLLAFVVRDFLLTSSAAHPDFEPVVTSQVLIAVVGATVAQSAAMAVAVVGFGYSKS